MFEGLAIALRQQIERLNKIYVCNVCKSSFLFKADIEDHMQHMPMHQGFAARPFE